jgi:hypothetical protein
MRRAIALLLPIAFACGDAREARVELDLRTEPCAGATCTVHLVGEGLIYDSGDTEVMLYSEIHTSSGTIALIEIGVDGSEITTVRYREILDGKVSLKGTVENEYVRVVREGSWEFGFEARDPAAAQEEPARVVTNGRVVLFELIPKDPVVTPPPPPPPPPVEEPPPPPPPPTKPKPRPRPDPDPDPDPDVVIIDAGGCDTSDSGGCDGGSDSGCEGSDSGCEGDSSASGCDSSDTSGCEGDVADSAGDCDGCEGDVALSHEARRRRAMLGMLRMSWPIWIAAWYNRKKRRQSVGSRANRSSMLEPSEREDETTTTVPHE